MSEYNYQKDLETIYKTPDYVPKKRKPTLKRIIGTLLAGAVAGKFGGAQGIQNVVNYVDKKNNSWQSKQKDKYLSKVRQAKTRLAMNKEMLDMKDKENLSRLREKKLALLGKTKSVVSGNRYKNITKNSKAVEDSASRDAKALGLNKPLPSKVFSADADKHRTGIEERARRFVAFFRSQGINPQDTKDINNIVLEHPSTKYLSPQDKNLLVSTINRTLNDLPSRENSQPLEVKPSGNTLDKIAQYTAPVSGAISGGIAGAEMASPFGLPGVVGGGIVGASMGGEGMRHLQNYSDLNSSMKYPPSLIAQYQNDANIKPQQYMPNPTAIQNPAEAKVKTILQSNPQDRVASYALDLFKNLPIKSPEEFRKVVPQLINTSDVQALTLPERSKLFEYLRQMYDNMN